MSKSKPVDMKTGAISKSTYDKRKKLEDAYKGANPISDIPPETLTDEGKEIFSVILRNLPAEILNETDSYSIEVVADAIATMRECRREIKRSGLIVSYTNNAGVENKDQNKAVLIYQKYSEILKKYIAELGLSPSARSKIANMATQDPHGSKKTLMELLNEDDDEDG